MELKPLEVEQAPRDRLRFLVTVLILSVTILAAVAALLQTHASTRESQASRDCVAKAIQLMGELQRSGQRSAYEVALATDFTVHMMDSIAMQGTALELEMNENSEEAAAYWERAEVLDAQAQALRALSTLFSDPRYAPQGDSLTPNVEAYLADWQAPIQDLLAQQQQAADLANQWGDKADAYASIITTLALALFLYGLSLVIHGRTRYLFVVTGTSVTALATLWTLWTMIA